MARPFPPPMPSDLEIVYSDAECAWESYWRGVLIGYTRDYTDPTGAERWEWLVSTFKSGPRYQTRDEAVKELWAFHYEAPTRWGQELRDKHAGALLGGVL